MPTTHRLFSAVVALGLSVAVHAAGTADVSAAGPDGGGRLPALRRAPTPPIGGRRRHRPGRRA
ncbi:MAG: hypothetical protein IPG72_07220 [Ardenticatenales bacterium]|nr:hypothetical protein [Ardenticatenales bacterium]